MKNFIKGVAALLICFLLFANAAIAQCNNVNPIYQDMLNWCSANGRNYFKVQVTTTNPSTDGTHFFSCWGKCIMRTGVGGYGPCGFTSNPAINFIYSDRTYKSTSSANGTTFTVNQPFSVKAGSVSSEWVSLDMATNVITVKSITYNFSRKITNVTRSGNTIVGVADGYVIILNMVKATYSGNQLPPYYTINND